MQYLALWDSRLRHRGHAGLYLICACGRDSKIAWPMDRTTLRAEILPRTRCSRCRQPAIDMRIIWEPPGVNPMDGARDPGKKRTD